MKSKDIADENTVNYRLTSMYICTSICDRKSGLSCFNNSSLAHTKLISATQYAEVIC